MNIYIEINKILKNVKSFVLSSSSYFENRTFFGRFLKNSIFKYLKILILNKITSVIHLTKKSFLFFRRPILTPLHENNQNQEILSLKSLNLKLELSD